MDRSEIKHPWLKTLSPLAIGLGAVLAMDSSAIASPQTFEIAQVRSRAIAPTPLNISPPPGTHISLPQSNSNYYYYNRDRHRSYRHYKNCDRDYHHHCSPRRRRRKKETVIIINSPSHHSLPTGGNYIRVVR